MDIADTEKVDRTDIGNRRQDVLDRLDQVSDPELDESVVRMGFIGALEVDDTEVSVTFRLPTFWCAANFAFLMAEDMRIAVETLPWVSRAAITLIDHFSADRINRGIADDLSFQEVFADEATGGLSEVRETFRQKAFLGRQAVLLDALLGRDGVTEALALRMDGLAGLVNDQDDEVALAASRYLAARRHDGGPSGSGEPAFTTLDGTAVDESTLADHRRSSRRVLHSARANAEMCRIYLDARYGDETEPPTRQARADIHNKATDRPQG